MEQIPSMGRIFTEFSHPFLHRLNPLWMCIRILTSIVSLDWGTIWCSGSGHLVETQRKISMSYQMTTDQCWSQVTISPIISGGILCSCPPSNRGDPLFLSHGFYFLFKKPDSLCSLQSIVCLVYNSKHFPIVVSCLDFGLSALLYRLLSWICVLDLIACLDCFLGFWPWTLLAGLRLCDPPFCF